MNRPWAAEREVSVELAEAMIGEQFPELAPVRAVYLSDGWDNTAFIVNDAYIFRFPRRSIAVELIETESRILPAIADRLPLAVPVPRFVGRSDVERFPWPFAGYRMLAGETACRVELSDAERSEAAEVLGEFLAALHAIPVEEARDAHVPPDQIRRLDLPYRAAQIAERLDHLMALGLIDDARPWLAIAQDVPRDFSAKSGTLVHGDLYVRHLLVDDEGRLSGVIDWGDVHIGDAAIDLGVVHGFVPAKAHDRFRRAYGAIDDDAWRVGRFKALHHAVILLEYGHDISDADLLREGQFALENMARG